MGRPKKRRCNETRIGDSAKELGSAPPAPEPLTLLDGDFLIDPYLENLGHSFDDGEAAVAPNSGSYGVMAGNDSVLWNLGSADLNAIDLGTHFSPHDMAEEPIVSPDFRLRAPALPCSCLATMYLAISSLQGIPSKVGAALAVIRAAATTAQAVLRCEQCGSPIANHTKPAFAAFQNTMLLGTLLPTIVNCYSQLLKRVDHEASMAEVSGYKMRFDILDEEVSYRPGLPPDEAKSVENALMEPDDWRAAVHRIIRNDIYGHEMTSPSLKGIISEMEQRQRTRHPKIDAFGDSNPINIFEERRCIGEKNAPCLRILDMTKVAMESLAIS
jgi:hypothetical protein